MFETFFLFFLAFVWIIFATIQDLKTREIANWLNFSLIIFALGFRFFYSIFFSGNFQFFYQGLIGLGIFFALGNILYYGKLFAGGDAKLLIALGAVLPTSINFSSNLGSLFLFLMVFLLVGAAYSIIVSTTLSLKNHKKFNKEFKIQFKKSRKIFYFSIILSIIFIILGFYDSLLFAIGVFIFLMPYLYLYAKTVDEISMVKNIETSKLREGDWLYKDVKIGKRVIKERWEGLKNREILILRRKLRKVLIREGVPFTPVFLFSFLIFFYLLSKGLGYSFW